MKSPAFQFYPDKWLSHTRRLSDVAYRVFHELLCWMWANAPDQCSVEASVEAVAVAVARPAEIVGAAMSDIQNQYAPLLAEQDGRWVCNGLRKEAEKQSAWREKSSRGGDLSARHRQEKYGSTAPIKGTTAPVGGATKLEPTREPTMNHPSAAAEPPTNQPSATHEHSVSVSDSVSVSVSGEKREERRGEGVPADRPAPPPPSTPKNQPPQKRWTYDHEAGEIRGVIPADIEKLKATFPYIDAQAVILDCEAYLGSDKCKREYTNVWAFVLNACKREQRHRWADTHEMDIRLEQQSRENVQTVIQQQRETAEREAREAKERACGRQN